jgi:hypothetical protein
MIEKQATRSLLEVFLAVKKPSMRARRAKGEVASAALEPQARKGWRLSGDPAREPTPRPEVAVKPKQPRRSRRTRSSSAEP